MTKNKKQKKESNLESTDTVITGRHAVLAALLHKQPVEKILLNMKTGTRRHAQVLQEAKNRGIPVQFVPETALIRKAGTVKHQDIVAILREMPLLTLEELMSQAQLAKPFPILALLDGIQDPHNLGAILRSAEGAGVNGVIVLSRRRASFSAVVSKTSAGAIHTLPIAQVTNLSRALEKLKKSGFWVIGTDDKANRSIWEVEVSSPITVAIGNEGVGLHRLVREQCDFLVKIPMFGKIESLNASVAAGIVFYEIRRKLLDYAARQT